MGRMYLPPSSPLVILVISLMALMTKKCIPVNLGTSVRRASVPIAALKTLYPNPVTIRCTILRLFVFL